MRDFEPLNPSDVDEDPLTFYDTEYEDDPNEAAGSVQDEVTDLMIRAVFGEGSDAQ